MTVTSNSKTVPSNGQATKGNESAKENTSAAVNSSGKSTVNSSTEEEDLLEQEIMTTIPVVDFKSILEKVKLLKTLNPIQQVKYVYKTFKEKEIVKGVVTGYSKISKKARGTGGEIKTLPAIMWQDQDGNGYMSAAVVLVGDAKEGGIVAGDSIQIEFLGRRPGAEVFDFKIHRLV